jgi:superfamily I DNA and RNA helicase
VLDRQQERLAEHLGDGYRVIRGVAGSGKTLVLTHRARFITAHFPGMQVLLLCYNLVLSKASSPTSETSRASPSTTSTRWRFRS